MNTSTPGFRQKILLIWVFVAIAICGIVLGQREMAIPIDGYDFKAYWAASRLFLQGRNPIDADNMLALESRTEAGGAMMAWNPPMLWVILLPVSWMPFQTALLIWLGVNVILLVISVFLLGDIFLPRGRLAPLGAILFVASIFPPAIMAINAGQVTFLVFFGVVSSLFFIKHDQWFWAGAVLILTSVKPHLVILVGPYLMVYMALRRKWIGWFGLCCAVVCFVAILFLLRPTWIADYSVLFHSPPSNWATPTLGTVLNILGLGPWTRFIGLGFFLLLPFFLKRTTAISIETASSILVLITVPTTFFGWSYDQSILLLPISQIVSWLYEFQPRTLERRLLILVMVTIIIIHISHRMFSMSDFFYFWVPLAWGAVYALTAWLKHSVGKQQLSSGIA